MYEYEKRKTKRDIYYKLHVLYSYSFTVVVTYIQKFGLIYYMSGKRKTKKETPGYIANRTTCIVFIMI